MKNKIHKLALFGNPVKHSLSPQIHKNFAQQFNLSIDYQLIQVGTDEFEHSVYQFFKSGGIGANVTLPHKLLATKVANKIKKNARFAEAVNTLYKNKNAQLCGDNTDGKGFVKDVTKRQGFKFKDKSILILGAGGAAQGIVPAILKKQPMQVVIANRSIGKAQNLCRFKKTLAVSIDELEVKNQQFDLIIHASSLGHQGKTLKFQPQHIHPNTIAYDLSYGKTALPFIQFCQTQGIQQTCDGLGMLVEQAAYSFKKWFGMKPDTHAIYQILKNSKST